jgi:hypothetical protein
LELIANIHGQFPDDEGPVFSKVILALQNNINSAKLAIPKVCLIVEIYSNCKFLVCSLDV